MLGPLGVEEVARQQAGRLGVAGIGMSAGAAGGAELDTQRKIDAATAAGDTEKARRLEAGRDLHALLTGVTEGAVERLSPVHTLNAGGKGVGRGVVSTLKEAAEEPATGLIQRGVVDPLTLDEHPDVTGPLALEATTGLMTAGGVKAAGKVVSTVADSLLGGKNPAPSQQAPTGTSGEAAALDQLLTAPPEAGGTPPANTGSDTNNGQQTSKATPASAAPAATLDDAGKTLDRIAELQKKKQGAALSLDEEIELDHAEKVVASTQIKNLEEEQRSIRGLETPRELDPVKAKALEDARAVRARPVPGTDSPTSSSSSAATPGAPPASVQSPIPQNTTNAPAAPPGQPPQTALANGQPTATYSPGQQAPAQGSPPTQADAFEADKTIQRLREQTGPLSLKEQVELDAAEKTKARLLVHNVLAMQERDGQLHPTTAKDLAAAQATLARPVPGEPPVPQASPASTAGTASTSSSSGSQAPGSSATATGGASPPGTSSGEPATTVDGNGRPTSSATSTSSTTGGQPAGASATTNDVTAPGTARHDGPPASDAADPNAVQGEPGRTGDRSDPSAVLLPGSDRNGNGPPTGSRDNGEAAEPVLADGAAMTQHSPPPPIHRQGRQAKRPTPSAPWSTAQAQRTQTGRWHPQAARSLLR